jgi:hypothetical protein
MTQFYELALGILVTWRVTHLLAVEAGPWEMLARMRRATGSGVLAQLFGCFYCLSLWSAAPLSVVLAHSWRHRLLLWPALSAGAILLERFASHAEAVPPPLFFEDQEDPNVLRS